MLSFALFPSDEVEMDANLGVELIRSFIQWQKTASQRIVSNQVGLQIKKWVPGFSPWAYVHLS